MQIVIDELMQAFEITDIKYFITAIAIIFGGLILWKITK